MTTSSEKDTVERSSDEDHCVLDSAIGLQILVDRINETHSRRISDELRAQDQVVVIASVEHPTLVRRCAKAPIDPLRANDR
jgi:hypothetical protein